MRVDYYHTGNATEERFSLDRVVVEPLPWPGNPARPIDDTNRGKYFFEVVDAATNRVVYSRGFASIYGEWETTAEAKETRADVFRVAALSRRPTGPVQIVLKKRDAQNVFREVWTITRRSRRQVRRCRPRRRRRGPLIKLQKSGDSADKLDLLILGDGYTAPSAASSSATRGGWWRCSSRRLAVQGAPRATSTCGASCPPSAESGISRPSTGVHRRSPSARPTTRSTPSATC